MKRILFAIGSLDIGGSEKQLVALAGGLVQKGFQCSVFALNGSGELRAHLNSVGIPVISAWRCAQQKRKPWRTAMAQLKLLLTTLRVKPDIVHAFLPLVTFMGAAAGKICNIPLVITSRRALGKHQERYRFLRPLDLLAHAWSHRVTVNSKAVWNDVVRRDHVDPHKLVLIYNAVDSALYEGARASRERMRCILGLHSGEKGVIVIANLIPYKGHSDLLTATALAIKKVPQTKLLVVGEDRGIGARLEDQADALGIRPVVKFLGKRVDIPELLAASDLAVLPSHEEGFSNSILEAMAAGLPVVATDVGGNREAIVEGETGLLVPDKKPSALADGMIDLLQDSAKASRFGEKGRLRAKEFFTLQKMIDAHLRLYNAVSEA